MRVEAVVFDAGETLFDETRMWNAWADWLSIPRLTFLTTLGAVIARGQHHREVFRTFKPDFDMTEEMQARIQAGVYSRFELADLYPDALPTLETLKRDHYRVGVVGNQPSGFTSCLTETGIELDLLTTSGDLGVEKPNPAFFTAISERLQLAPNKIAYVGDRVDNDVLAAQSVGMFGIFLRRGPWGHIPENPDVPYTIDSLEDLHALLDADPGVASAEACS
ncbi:MAG: HAD family hydrolase [Actinobacteria bacterium]|nr:HAD family hydrolase [Actinomycetota bacterium]